MKSNLIFVAAMICSALLTASAFAGGHHGLSSSAMSTGHSSAGESSLQRVWEAKHTHERSFNAQVASPLDKPAAQLTKSTITGGPNRGTPVIFTPASTIDISKNQSVTTSTNSAGNITIDHPFSSSILATGLNVNTSRPTADAPQSGTQASSLLHGSPITVAKTGSPIVQVVTSSSATNTSSSATATGR
jgi:hypothetical protein